MASTSTAADSTHSNGKDSNAATGTTGTTSTTSIAFYEDAENLKKLCDFLRSRQGPPVREALLMEKRVHYLKGTSTIATAKW
jgi:hypothetical protein